MIEPAASLAEGNVHLFFSLGFFSAVSWSARGTDPVYVFDHSFQKIERFAIL
jgi:hypothetical protein